VFVDSKGIEAGAQWTSVILDALSKCVAVIIIIEKNWSAEKLHDPSDWVRLEISQALKHRKYLLPLFVDGAAMPLQASLPEEIRSFAERQGVFIDSRSSEIFVAALSVVSDYLRRSCPSTLVFEREPDKTGLVSRCTIIADFLPEGHFTALKSRTATASLPVNHGRTAHPQNIQNRGD
jgi:hypothetical protein